MTHTQISLCCSLFLCLWGFVSLLVGADAGGFESLGAQLLILVGDQVDAERELVDIGALAAEIEDADLGVWHTTVEAGLGVWLRDGNQSAVLLLRLLLRVAVPCSCSSDNISLDGVPLRRYLLGDYCWVVGVCKVR